MVVFILRRLAAGVILLFVVTSLVFLLLYAGSGDVARNILGQTATQEEVAAKAQQLGLDRPVLAQYFDWLTGALTGDFGDVLVHRQRSPRPSVADRRSPCRSCSARSCVTAIVSVSCSGCWAAVRGGWVDRVVQGVSVVGFAIPNFLIAIALVLVFAINLGWFQPTGYVALRRRRRPDGSSSITLPIIALAHRRHRQRRPPDPRRRASTPCGRTTCARCAAAVFRTRSVVYKHVLRNAAGPALAVLGVQFIGLLGGAVIVEKVFAIPGLGSGRGHARRARATSRW